MPAGIVRAQGQRLTVAGLGVLVAGLHLQRHGQVGVPAVFLGGQRDRGPASHLRLDRNPRADQQCPEIALRGGMARIDREGGAQCPLRGFVLPEREQRHAKIGMCLRPAGRIGCGGLERLRRIGVPMEALQHKAQPIPRRGIARPQGGCAAVAVFRQIRLVGIRQQVAQVVVGRGEGGIKRDGLPVSFFGTRRMARGAQHGAQVGVVGGRSGGRAEQARHAFGRGGAGLPGEQSGVHVRGRRRCRTGFVGAVCHTFVMSIPG